MLSRPVTRLSATRNTLTPLPHDSERRRALRVDLPFPAMVRGLDVTGDRFSIATQLDNLSAYGLYLRLQRAVTPGTKLFVVVRLSQTPESEAPAPYVAVHGTVHRTEAHDDGQCGVAVEFERHRFLYAPGTADRL